MQQTKPAQKSSNWTCKPVLFHHVLSTSKYCVKNQPESVCQTSSHLFVIVPNMLDNLGHQVDFFYFFPTLMRLNNRPSGFVGDLSSNEFPLCWSDKSPLLFCFIFVAIHTRKHNLMPLISGFAPFYFASNNIFIHSTGQSATKTVSQQLSNAQKIF